MLGSRVCMSQVDFQNGINFDMLNPLVKLRERMKQIKSKKAKVKGF